MGSISDYLENALLDHVLGTASYTQPTIYVGLSTADPTDAGSGDTEPTYTAYARVAHSAWDAAASRATENTGTITFPQKADGSSETITHFTIYDASSGGNMLAHGAFTTQKTIVVNNTPTIADGELDVSVTTGGMTTYLANALLEHVFEGTAYTQDTLYVALSTTDPGDSGTQTGEPSGNNYSRVAHSAWDSAASGASENTGTISFPTPSGSWGLCAYHFIADASTSGNALLYGALDQSQTPDNGDTVQYADGALDITLD
jgi:hypothetical protein